MKINGSLKNWIFLTMMFSVKICSGQIGDVLQIDSCYVIAQSNYPLIRQYELIEKANEYTISNANKAYLPQLSVTGIGAYIFGGFPQLGPSSANKNSEDFKFIGTGQLNQVVWDGGATRTQKNIVAAQSSVEKANVDVQMYALKERINQLYFGILLIDEQMKQIDIQIEMFNRNATRLQLLNKNGYSLSTESNELRAEVLKAKQRKTEFEYSRRSYLYMLSLFLGRQLGESVKLLKPDIGLSAESKVNRPELLLFQNQRKLVNEQYSFNTVKLMPKVGLLGVGVLITPGINLGLQEKSSLALAGLNLSWELGGLYTHSGNKKLLQVNLDKIQIQQETFLFNNKIQSTQSSTEIEKYSVILKEDDEILSLRSSIREGYQLQYDNKACSMFELINATDKESEARSNRALHEVQLLLSTYQLKSTTGN